MTQRTKTSQSHLAFDTFLAMTMIIFSLAGADARGAVVKPARVEKYEQCVIDLCGDEHDDRRFREAMIAETQILRMLVEQRFGARVKAVLGLLPHREEWHNFRQSREEFAQFLLEGNLQALTLSLIQASPRAEVDRFYESNAIHTFANTISDIIGSPRAKTEDVFNAVHIKLPPHREEQLAFIDNRLNELLEDPAKREGLYQLDLQRALIGKSPSADLWGKGPLANYDKAIPTWISRPLFPDRYLKADLMLSRHSLVSGDAFNLFHELSHIADYYSRMGDWPESVEKNLSTVRQCIRTTQPDYKGEWELENTTRTATQEDLADILAAKVLKPQGSTKPPLTLCSELAHGLADEWKLSFYRDRWKYDSQHHSSEIFRTANVYFQMHGRIPESCSNAIREEGFEPKFKNCMP